MEKAFSVVRHVGEPRERGSEIAGVMTLLRELESSLDGSRKALLALDLGKLRRQTGEQELAAQALKTVMRSIGFSFLGDQTDAQAGNRARLVSSPGCEELAAAAQRILDAGRLHMALLARAQRKLRVIANMLAGPAANYGRVLAANGFTGSGAQFSGRQRGETI